MTENVFEFFLLLHFYALLFQSSPVEEKGNLLVLTEQSKRSV